VLRSTRIDWMRSCSRLVPESIAADWFNVGMAGQKRHKKKNAKNPVFLGSNDLLPGAGRSTVSRREGPMSGQSTSNERIH
jgi:hypothetical protein